MYRYFVNDRRRIILYLISFTIFASVIQILFYKVVSNNQQNKDQSLGFAQRVLEKELSELNHLKDELLQELDPLTPDPFNLYRYWQVVS